MKCRYCGKQAGFLRFAHKECIEMDKKEKLRIAEEKKKEQLRILEEEKKEIKIIRDSKIEYLIKLSKYDEKKESLEGISFSEYGLVPMLKSEKLLFLEYSPCCYETKSKISYQGGSSGVSFRVMKGVSYRVGASKGERITTEQQVLLGSGYFFFSTAGIYFKCEKKSFRIRYNKIVAMECYSDGIIIHKDGVSALPVIIKFDDSEIIEKMYNAMHRFMN